jgi:hypothetical protein
VINGGELTAKAARVKETGGLIVGDTTFDIARHVAAGLCLSD